METDYISREAAKRLIADIQLGESPKDAPCTVYQSGIHEGLNIAFGAIVTMRSADVRPVKLGEWMDTEDTYADPPARQTCRCSNCGRVSPRPLGDFCRWCGADMRPEGETP